jgi:hypothetical protein
MVSGLASDNPMYLIFPSSTSFFSSPIYSTTVFSARTGIILI